MKDALSHIRDDGTVDDTRIETHYRPCKGIVSDSEAKCVRVFIDESGFDLETRILYDTLVMDGWMPPSKLQAQIDQLRNLVCTQVDDMGRLDRKVSRLVIALEEAAASISAGMHQGALMTINEALSVNRDQ